MSEDVINIHARLMVRLGDHLVNPAHVVRVERGRTHPEKRVGGTYDLVFTVDGARLIVPAGYADTLEATGGASLEQTRHALSQLVEAVDTIDSDTSVGQWGTIFSAVRAAKKVLSAP